MENNSKEDKLGWTKEEKFELLEALREVGTGNVEQIKEFVCSKTDDEIRAALSFYTMKALARPGKIQKRERKVNLPVVPLSGWVNYIIDKYGYDEYQTETDIALRLIAETEDKPPAILTEKIDFRKLYLVLAEALEGKPLSKDKYICSIIAKCIVETALTSKALNRGSFSYKNILRDSCYQAKEDFNEFLKPTEDIELASVRNVSSRKNYNPLNIPKNKLKFSTPI